MGRPRKPTALKILDGDQPCRINRSEPKSPRGIGQCPDHLGEVGKAAWQRAVDRLDEMGLLTAADAEAVALYASTYEEWDKARKAVDEDGMTVVGAGGSVKAHPLLMVIKECRAQMNRLLSQFGMTPSSRSGLNVAGRYVPQKPEDDPLLAFLAKSSKSNAKKAKA